MSTRATRSTPWPEARRIAGEGAVALEPVQVTLEGALGAALAASLHAPGPLPTHDTAAMDGYAVTGSEPWTVRGSLRAGDPPPRNPLRPGEAVEIATGAPVPERAEAVLPYEQASRREDVVTGEHEVGRHIRRRGEDCVAGDLLLPAGTVLTPTALGLAAGVGQDVLEVHRAPQVAVALTGNEIVRTGLPAPGRVRDAIGPMLPGTVRWAGGEPWETQQLRDKTGALEEMITATDADVVVVCGSSSAGPADHLRPTLRALDAEVLVSSVACRPGHPMVLARVPSGPWVVGLPGNPYAALVSALTLLVPLLAGLAGRRPPRPRWATAGTGIRSHPRDTRLVAARRTG
ncbi:MAG: molybdopterin molybdotransferase MoeA, partial [Actinomycetes bacterium]